MKSFGSVASILLSVAKSESTPNIVELAESVGDLSTLVGAVVAGDLVDTLSSPGPFTVFAPTNDGFGKLPSDTLDGLMKPENKAQLVDILTYHVLPEAVPSDQLKFFQRVETVEGKNVHVFNLYGHGVFVSPDGKDFKRVTAADNVASNGVVHIIDGVLIPPTSAALSDSKPNIVELAESVDDLSTLVGAVVAGDLADTLSSPGPFTVFAPTNEGFGKLPSDTLDGLMKPENKAQLVDILTYHVLPEAVFSNQLKVFQRVETVEGKNVHIYKGKRGVFVTPDGKDFKMVTAADNEASNGVVHIIDGVLIPPTSAVSSTIAASTVPLATFDSVEDSLTHTWRQQNDPVMGGASSGSFSIADGVGIMSGTVADIPSLGVPGFIKVQTTDSKAWADVSNCAGLVLNVKSTSTPASYDGWRVAFGSDKSGCGKFFARGFKADFNAPEDDFGEVQVPFDQFTKCWDDGSGDAIETCQDKPEFCPSSSRLQDLQTMSIWAEGKAADVKIEVKSVGAYGCTATVVV